MYSAVLCFTSIPLLFSKRPCGASATAVEARYA
jgi:hypothetical protein